jgi:hypothetical protein
MNPTGTPTTPPRQSPSVTFAAQVRAGAPGRGPRVSEISRLSSVEFARLVRSSGPGRAKH